MGSSFTIKINDYKGRWFMLKLFPRIHINTTTAVPAFIRAGAVLSRNFARFVVSTKINSVTGEVVSLNFSDPIFKQKVTNWRIPVPVEAEVLLNTDGEPLLNTDGSALFNTGT